METDNGEQLKENMEVKNLLDAQREKKLKRKVNKSQNDKNKPVTISLKIKIKSRRK